MQPAACSHLGTIHHLARPHTRACAECLALGDTWVHLRMCLECGQIGCCDDSKNKHATAHFRSSGHPLIRSVEPGEEWGWCYVDEVVMDSLPRTVDSLPREGSERPAGRGSRR